MNRYIIASSKQWFFDSAKSPEFAQFDFIPITRKEELTLDFLAEVKPRYIFFPHWNWIVPPEIYDHYECVCFHTAPLPFGRGGSPIQNLILRNLETSPVCALRMNDVLDGGPIYAKGEVSLAGTIDDIFARAAPIIQALIVEIITNEPTPVEQVGEPVYFKRRTPRESELPDQATLTELYNHIRMLDSDAYPRSFLRHGNFTLEFKQAKLGVDSVEATVVIKKT